MDKHLQSNQDEQELNEALGKILPKDEYFKSLDFAVRNMSVNVNNHLKARAEKKSIWKRRILRVSPVFATALCLVVWFVVRDSNTIHEYSNIPAPTSVSMPTSSVSTTDEFDGIVHDDIKVVMDDYQHFDDPVLLFDSMTSSDINSVIDELTENI